MLDLVYSSQVPVDFSSESFMFIYIVPLFIIFEDASSFIIFSMLY